MPTCLFLFLALAQQNQTSMLLSVPQPVVELAQKRYKSQFEEHFSGNIISFESQPKKNCTQIGIYFYAGDSLVIEGQAAPLNGRTAYLLADLLDGKKIIFSLNSETEKNSPKEFCNSSLTKCSSPLEAQTKLESNTNYIKGWLWMAGGIAVGLIGYWAYQQNRTSELGKQAPTTNQSVKVNVSTFQ